MIVPKDQLQITVDCEGERVECNDSVARQFDPGSVSPHEVPRAVMEDDTVEMTLEALAWGRSGDKGNKANIGIIARHPDFVPFIAEQITETRVADLFQHFLEPGQAAPVERFYMPGPNAFNFLLHDVLGGGGVASLRADPQGKGYAQVLLAEKVRLPRSLAERHDVNFH
jgi:hypothetical protein